jgi:PhoD-like phosphatase
MIKNLTEDFLYDRLPEGIIELDERGLIQAVVGGFQDRLEDLRAYGKKLQLFFTTEGLPETGNNAVLVDLVSDQGKAYTRSLDIEDETPADGTAALVTWAAEQLGLDEDRLSNVRYGVDLLRLVDTNTLDYLAITIGAVLYQTSIIPQVDEQSAHQHIVSTYFPRLKFKGTARSFEVLGRILGFDDIRMTPLWGRLSPRVPNDVGDPANDPDFAADPEYYPKQTFGPLYDPHKTDDGPFYSWTGTVNHGTASTQFYTQVVNGFNPYIDVVLISVTAYGTVVDPASGSYALGSSGSLSLGGPHKKAYVDPPGAGVRFRAIAEGASFNGLEIQVGDAGTNKTLTISDRLSAIKYRSSYFDLGITADMDKVEEIFGSSAAKPNKDLAANPTLTYDGTAVSPYRPWISGSISTGTATSDWVTQTGSNAPTVITARTEATSSDRQLNMDSLVAAGIQVAQAFEEVRPATRIPRRALSGFLIRDYVPYALYECTGTLFVSTGALTYSGTAANNPAAPYTVTKIELLSGTGTQSLGLEFDPSDSHVIHFSADVVSGSYRTDTNTFWFSFSSVGAGTLAVATWLPTSTEVLRDEPVFAAKGTNNVCPQSRAEDDANGLADEMADDYPWRRDLVLGGELVELDTYITSVVDVAVDVVADETAVSDETGTDLNVFAVPSPATGHARLLTEVRPVDSDYQAGKMPIGYAGTFKDLSTLTEAEQDLLNTETDLETMFEPGFSIYHVGLAQGVLVADVPKFFGPHHRDRLVGWMPFNEHAEDDLTVTDHSFHATPAVLTSIQASDRRWSDERGWYLRIGSGGRVQFDEYRDLVDDITISFWINPDALAGTTSTDIVRHGPVRFELNNATGVLNAYDTKASGFTALVGSWLLTPGTWTFVYIRRTSDESVFGAGDLSTSAAESVFSDDLLAATEDDTLLTVAADSRAFAVHDLRIWNEFKTQADMDLVRYHAPVSTICTYRLGLIQSVDRQDRYGLRVLPNGFVTTDALPAWLRSVRMGLVRRYDSMGVYQGESRFKESGLGGGRSLPPSYVLGNQFTALTGYGTVVVSTEHGAMPGVNAPWLADSFQGTYAILNTGSTSTGTVASHVWSGTSSPFPNAMAETNPNRDRIWVAGQDGYVYEVTLDGNASSTFFVSQRVVRERTDAELELNGILQVFQSTGSVYAVTAQGTIFSNQLLVEAGTTIISLSTNASTGEVIVLTNGATEVTVLHPLSLRYAEQPTGAEVLLSGSGSMATVVQFGTSGSFAYVQQAWAGTVTTPPVYLYLNSRVLADVDDAYTAWTDRLDTSNFGNQQVPAVAARDSNGLLEFENTGTLVPGTYRLSIESGNIGKTDEDFDGFAVEITVNSTVLQKRLLEGQQGFNIRGTDIFEFDLVDGVAGDWLLSVLWTNHAEDSSKGTARQLAIFSYELRHLGTELYQVDIAASGTTPSLTQLYAGSFSGSVPGGWLMALNSYGSVVQWTHESLVYPGNDTVTSTLPLSDILTGNTAERREDVLCPADVVISDPGTLTFPSFGTLSDAAIENPPLWLWSGALTSNPSAVISAKMSFDSALVRAVVSTGTDLTNPIYSDYVVEARAVNNNVAKMTVEGLEPWTKYYYAIETAGSVYTAKVGQFTTFGTGARSFSFAVASCSNNIRGLAVNGPVFDSIRAKAPLFFLHTGDLHYNNIASNSVDLYRDAYDAIFVSSGSYSFLTAPSSNVGSDRQEQLWREIPVVYIWDDHDFGPNDADSTAPGREAARLTYREYVPHYQLPAGNGNSAIYYHFDVGRCRFIVTDNRSERSPAADTDDASKTVLGSAQKVWFKQQVLQANADPDVGAIFWVNTFPWNGTASAGADDWQGYTTERTELSTFFNQNGVTRLFILSGDMHALAIDDGRNADFATGSTGSNGFPLFQAAPLDQTSSDKAGPYLIGPVPAAGASTSQFGLVTVTDNGSNMFVTFTGYDSAGVLISSGGTDMNYTFNGTDSPRP